MEIIVTKETLLLKPGRHEVGDSLGQALIQNGFAEVAKKWLPQKWEELGSVNGWYVYNNSIVDNAEPCLTRPENRNIFPTKEEAEAVIAMAQLSQLRDVYNNGWKPNWSDGIEKWCIIFSSGNICIETYHFDHHWLCFETAELAQEFVENFKDLILIAKPYI